MISYSAYYIKDKSIEELTSIAGGEKKLQLALGEVKPFADSPWLLCGFRDGAYPPDDEVLWGRQSLAGRVSQKFGEVIYLYGDVKSDAFVYEHARDGAILRKLVWFPMLDENWTPGWLCAQGEPEPWEAGLFFGPNSLERNLEQVRSIFDQGSGDEILASKEAEIRQIWETGRIAAMKEFPKCDGTVAFHVEKVFGLKR